jgi:phosphohistidine phosphatase
MKLVLVRHADAGDRDEWAKTGQADSLRPLSDKGRKQMKGVADGLRTLVPKCDVVVTSPYTRAVQTAEFLRDAYERQLVETKTLEPEAAPSAFESWLRNHFEEDVVVVVGHEPHLGTLTTWLMTGASESHVEFKKGGACLLEFSGTVKKGAGALRWLIGSKELGALK